MEHSSTEQAATGNNETGEETGLFPITKLKSYRIISAWDLQNFWFPGQSRVEILVINKLII